MKILSLIALLILCGCQDTLDRGLVVLFASDIKSATSGPVMGVVADELTRAGFRIHPVETPCHGSDAEEENGLDCWRRRIESGQLEMFTDYCADLSRELDEMGVTDVRAVGLSRGGYVAMTCAANDERFRRIALLMPVTDLRRLREFAGFTVPRSLDLKPLTDRRILVRIGKSDTRVGTDAATAFAHSTGATLELIDTTGHKVDPSGIADWLKQ